MELCAQALPCPILGGGGSGRAGGLCSLLPKPCALAQPVMHPEKKKKLFSALKHLTAPFPVCIYMSVSGPWFISGRQGQPRPHRVEAPLLLNLGCPAVPLIPPILAPPLPPCSLLPTLTLAPLPSFILSHSTAGIAPSILPHFCPAISPHPTQLPSSLSETASLTAGLPPSPVFFGFPSPAVLFPASPLPRPHGSPSAFLPTSFLSPWLPVPHPLFPLLLSSPDSASEMERVFLRRAGQRTAGS